MDRYDLQYNNEGLAIVDNDVVWDISDSQHIEDTINAAPGWWKENFTDGVNVRKYLSSSQQERVLARAVKIQLESDLYTVTSPRCYFDLNGKLILEPNASI